MSNTFDQSAYVSATRQKPKLSQQFADAVTGGIGSWGFVFGQALTMAAWITVNTTNIVPFIPHFDPSLILLNLALSTEAALGAAFILMSQGRQSDIDSLIKKHDLEVDKAADGRVNGLDKKLDMILSILSPEQLKKIKESTHDSDDDANAVEHKEKKPTLRERFSDAVTRGMGSWKFVIGHSLFMAAWITINTTTALPFIPKFDPNLLLLNLFLSTEAAFAGAFIMMSQSRRGQEDRKTLDRDLEVDVNAERKLGTLDIKLDAILSVLTPGQLQAIAASNAAAQATANNNTDVDAGASTNDNKSGTPAPEAAQAPKPQRPAAGNAGPK